MRSIRAGMGLGDALYLQSVVRHLTASGEKLLVRTAWPEVFRQLNGSVQVAPFSRAGINVLAHYVSRKGIPGTTQFEDCCINAGVKDPIEMRLDWKPTTKLADEVVKQAAGRPIVLVQMMRPPMNRRDKFGASLLPNGDVVQACIDQMRRRVFLVQVGSGICLHYFNGIDLDLSNKTTVTELLDIASVASGFIGYVSFFVPLAESFGKPALFVWASRGLKDRIAYVRQITPEKVLHRKDLSQFVIDDWDIERVKGVADAFLR